MAYIILYHKYVFQAILNVKYVVKMHLFSLLLFVTLKK